MTMKANIVDITLWGRQRRTKRIHTSHYVVLDIDAHYLGGIGKNLCTKVWRACVDDPQVALWPDTDRIRPHEGVLDRFSWFPTVPLPARVRVTLAVGSDLPYALERAW